MRRTFRLATDGAIALASRQRASLHRVILRERRHTKKTTCGGGVWSLNSMPKPRLAQAM